MPVGVILVVGFVALLLLVIAVAGAAACVRSSQISRREEETKEGLEPLELVAYNRKGRPRN